MGMVSCIVVGFSEVALRSGKRLTPSFAGDATGSSDVDVGGMIGLKGLAFLVRGARTSEVPFEENGRLTGEGGMVVL